MPSIIEVDTIKNKTGTQNTVLSTDGSGNNTISVGSIKSNTGSNTGLSIASDGQVTISQNNPTITLGSNASINTQDYFITRLSGNQTVADDTLSIIQFVDNVSGTYDPQSWFASYKFTPQKAGKYFIYLTCNAYNNTGVNRNQIYHFALSKNNVGSSHAGELAKTNIDTRNAYFYAFGGSVTAILDFNGSSDYVCGLFYPNNGGLYTDDNIIQETFSEFGGFRIGL